VISVVCVFNDAEHLERRLLNSLRRQTAQHEVVTIDNRNNRFSNAASALNSGSAQATGDWVLFAHQDVELLSSDWLRKAENTLQSLSDVGWVGVAGRTSDGAHRGFLRNGAALQGLPFERAVEVQTLDELLLIHKRESAETHYFDEAVPGWHGYGVEACCSAIRKGLKNYVLSLAVWHDSPLTNINGLSDSHEYVWQKHGRAMGKIHTTCGVLPVPSSLWGSDPLRYPKRVLRRMLNLTLLPYGFRDTSVNWFHETMDSLTEASPLIECLHSYADQEPLEARGFGPGPSRRHPIVHRFSGLDLEKVSSTDVVVAPDLAAKFVDNPATLNQLRGATRKCFVCLRIADLTGRVGLLRRLEMSTRPKLTVDSEGTRIAVLDLSAD
jgi:hypothetical protein